MSSLSPPALVYCAEQSSCALICGANPVRLHRSLIETGAALPPRHGCLLFRDPGAFT